VASAVSTACTYDFMRDLELAPKSDKMGVLTRGVWQLAADHQPFAEASYSRSKTWYVGTSNRLVCAAATCP
jgi:iron complex outermembrane receptor protein